MTYDLFMFICKLWECLILDIYIDKKTSQELQMLSRSRSYEIALKVFVFVFVTVFVNIFVVLLLYCPVKKNCLVASGKIHFGLYN